MKIQVCLPICISVCVFLSYEAEKRNGKQIVKEEILSDVKIINWNVIVIIQKICFVAIECRAFI